MKTSLFIVGLIVAAGSVWAQGSLTPPGAPAPTMRTLDELDAAIAGTSNAVSQIQDETRIDLATVAGDSSYHHVISQPGSYYLSGNLEVTKNSGIMINSTNVVLDLNGFAISRASGSEGFGIDISGGMDSAVVRNGSISGFQDGIRCYYSPSYAIGCLFEKLAVSGCSGWGISAGDTARIVDCRAHSNSGNGIYAGNGSTLSGCTASGNTGSYGIFTGSGSTLSGCSAYHNTATYGFYANTGSTLSGCNANGNTGSYGIYAIDGSTISGCTASYNSSDFGIYASSDATVSGCTANDNTGSGSSSYGILIGQGSTVIDCTASYNSNTNSPSTAEQGGGIKAFYGSTVKNCTARSNRGDGICINSSSHVSGNNCDSNGYNGDGAGIHATGGDNRIDGNTVTDNDRGIDVEFSGNFITRNTASGNTTQYDISAGNDTGTIQTSPVGAGAWDNFEF